MDHIRFDAGDMTLIIACKVGNVPRILYWGKKLQGDIQIEDIHALTKRRGVLGSADVSIDPSLAMEIGLGYAAPAGFEAHRDGRSWGSIFTVYSAAKYEDRAEIQCRDNDTQIALNYDIIVDPETGLFQFSSSITNICDDEGSSGILTVNKMATAVLPIPGRMTELIGFTGRWADEFRRERLRRFSGSYVRENKRGRTSHDSFPAIMLVRPDTREKSGEAYGLHLAWSGNHIIRIDTLMDGRVMASMGALLFPGEIRLRAGETYKSPTLVAGYSSNGLSKLSRYFHEHVRNNLMRKKFWQKERPVHYNSWEAIYFDHDLEKLKLMADKAAAIGIERFVLDDGWFGSRRNEKSGLGDWVVSDAIYPDGLKPLIDHVTGLGMEMGIWFEPEMVNPDSDLFRAHPDWILELKGKEQIPFRNQYVLDISRSEVSEYLFKQIDSVLSDHDISYVKWDMNRDLNHPGNAMGYAKPYAHVMALYALIERIRNAHPDVEIESCASGGGRPDYGILAHTDRVWTSDSNDAIDRQNIQKGASHFLPLNILGSHVGPAKCHITGRSLSMSMRAATAMMGHMGVELNLLDEPDTDLSELKKAISLYKKYRHLIHNGELYRIDTPRYINALGIVSKDKKEAIYSVAFLTGYNNTHPITIPFPGIRSKFEYQVNSIWPHDFQSSTTLEQKELEMIGIGSIFSGSILKKVGLQLPPSFPETTHLFYLQRREA